MGGYHWSVRKIQWADWMLGNEDKDQDFWNAMKHVGESVTVLVGGCSIPPQNLL